MRKKKVLLNWFEMPGRKELLDIFVFQDTSLEFVHLYHYSEKSRKEKYSPYEMIYWFDYQSPFELLHKVKPDIVITSNGEGLYDAALIMAANHLGIRTYCMQHGIVAPSIYEEIQTTKYKRQLNKSFYYFKVVQFYTNLVRKLKWQQKKQVFRFFRTFVSKGAYIACQLNRFPLRLPTGYICFTQHNAHYYVNRDGNIQDRILEVGVPFFDHIFQSIDRETADQQEPPYALLIDTMLIKDGFPVSEELMVSYHRQINAIARQKGLRLKIKLHPWAYESRKLLVDSNVEYIRAIDKTELSLQIKHAHQVFSFFSTLVFPAVFLNPNIVAVEFGDFHFPDDMKGNGKLDVITIADQGHDFDDRQKFEKVTPQFLKEIEERYLYRADGKSKERLQRLLESQY